MSKGVFKVLFWFVTALGVIPLLSLLSAINFFNLENYQSVANFSSSHPYFSPIMFSTFFVGAIIASFLGDNWRLIFLTPLFLAGMLPLITNSGWNVTGAIFAFKADKCPHGWIEYSDASGRFLLGVEKKQNIGETGGNSSISLLEKHLPKHDHGLPTMLTGGGSQGLNGSGGTLQPHDKKITGTRGKSEKFNIMPPYVTVRFCVRL